MSCCIVYNRVVRKLSVLTGKEWGEKEMGKVVGGGGEGRAPGDQKTKQIDSLRN
jgi:hypothetical protein